MNFEETEKCFKLSEYAVVGTSYNRNVLLFFSKKKKINKKK